MPAYRWRVAIMWGDQAGLRTGRHIRGWQAAVVGVGGGRRRQPRTLCAHWHEHRGLAHIVRQRHPRRPGPATLRQHLELEGGGAAGWEGASGSRRPGARHGGGWGAAGNANAQLPTRYLKGCRLNRHDFCDGIDAVRPSTRVCE